VHRGKKDCLLPKPKERMDSISNSHASRTLPETWNDKRLSFVFALNYRLDCGSANGACRVRPTLAAHRPQTKNPQEKNDAAPKRVGSHIPDLRGAQQQELQVRPPERIKGAGGPRSPLHLILTHHHISYSRYPEEHCCLPRHTFRRLLPHRNVTNHGTANPSRPRRVVVLPLPSPTPTCYIASTARP